MTDEEHEPNYPRFVFPGCTYIYLLPTRDEDILKLGFTRNPWQRMSTLHRRFFDFFDLDRALLLEVEKLKDARRIERLMIEHFAANRAPAPLAARAAAAGKTEWFRGVGPEADALLRDTAASEGWILHAPLAEWLHARLAERGDLIHDWSSRMLEVIEYEVFNPRSAVERLRLEQALREFLDVCSAVGMDVRKMAPSKVVQWYLDGGFR